MEIGNRLGLEVKTINLCKDKGHNSEQNKEQPQLHRERNTQSNNTTHKEVHEHSA
ncbi:Uncharacterized protein DAT39_022251 [Clarias magur]|uniref:Uncharacterized protein n=1 Tax=Clarias magur TaxID=1594786 RepID=A0A8J4WR36_CLAMG|nr:Uncharacterized protein DAT39_022251 [Clarias magur]